MTTTTHEPEKATDERTDDERAREGCCADLSLPCFDHFDHRCPNGHSWCNVSRHDDEIPSGATCLACLGIRFDG